MRNEQDGLIASVLGELDERLDVNVLAERLAYSRAQYSRIAKRRLGDSPMAVRKRLLMERAAYRMNRTGQSVTEIAFDAGYQSLEGFVRAFRSAFGVPPTQYRKLKATEFWLDLSERLHYMPLVDARQQGKKKMNVTNLMTEHHCWELLRFIEACEQLPESRLDTPVNGYEPQPWCEPTVTLRQMLSRASAFAAPWMEAINGEKTEYEPQTLGEMKDAIPLNRDGFLRIAEAVDRDDSYDLTFVDAGCEPPHVFSYGGVLAHALTNAAYRRMVISQELRSLNVGIDRVRDPIDYVKSAIS